MVFSVRIERLQSIAGWGIIAKHMCSKCFGLPNVYNARKDAVLNKELSGNNHNESLRSQRNTVIRLF